MFGCDNNFRARIYGPNVRFPYTNFAEDTKFSQSIRDAGMKIGMNWNFMTAYSGRVSDRTPGWGSDIERLSDQVKQLDDERYRRPLIPIFFRDITKILKAFYYDPERPIEEFIKECEQLDYLSYEGALHFWQVLTQMREQKLSPDKLPEYFATMPLPLDVYLFNVEDDNKVPPTGRYNEVVHETKELYLAVIMDLISSFSLWNSIAAPFSKNHSKRIENNKNVISLLLNHMKELDSLLARHEDIIGQLRAT